MSRQASAVLLAAALGLSAGCEPPAQGPQARTPGIVRAERRAFDGAPPVIPHKPFGVACTSCHSKFGLEVTGVGFAPPSPHEETPGMSALSRCQQCHVFAETSEQFRANAFAGLRQDLRRGARLSDLSPPVLPHQTLLRENCAACHSGPAAREEIRCTHPERIRCEQCHAQVAAAGEFARP